MREQTRALPPLLTAAVAFAVLVAFSVPAAALPWPYQPFDQTHGLGNHYLEYQNYGGSGYWHDGIDLVTPGPVQTYSVQQGTVTHITYNDPLYSGIMIGNPVPGGAGWLYWHITSTTFQYDIGDLVDTSAYIGTTAFWPVSAFHHVHFNKVVGTGGYPWSWYTATDNPLLHLEPRTDPDPPVLETTYQGRIFAFRRNQASTILDPTALSGDVDIISRIYDIVGLPQWRLNPWKVEYWIDGGAASVPVTTSLSCSGVSPADALVNVIYSLTSPLMTMGNYDSRIFYFIVTNTDGDGMVESADANFSWQTAAYGPGDYWVNVRATDIGGNAVTNSMMCTVSGTLNVALYLPEASYDFGQVPAGQFAIWEMRVQNNGSDWLSVRSVTSDNPVYTVSPPHFFVPPAGEAAAIVRFEPQFPGTYSGMLTIATNDPTAPQVFVRVKGRGIDVAAAEDGAVRESFGITGMRPLGARGVEIHYALDRAAAGQAAVPGAVIRIYDVAGREVRRAALGMASSGPGVWVWDGQDGMGIRCPSGVYYIRLASVSRTAHGSCVLIR